MIRRALFPTAAAVALACGIAATASGDEKTLLMNPAWTVAGGATAVAAWVGARRLPPGRRAAWTLVALAATAWFLGQLAWDVEALGGDTSGFPTTADAFWLLSPAFLLWAVTRLVADAGPTRKVVGLDAAAATVGVIALAVGWLYEPLVGSGPGLSAKGVAVGYAVLYGAVLVLWVDAHASTASVRAQPGPTLVLVGVLANGVAWVAYAADMLGVGYTGGRGFDLLWVVGQLAIGAGVLLAGRGAGLAVASPLEAVRRRAVLPACGLVALVATHIAFGVTGRPLGARITLQVGVLALAGLLVLRNRVVTTAAERIRREATQLLERRNEELEAFATTASHDLKAPAVSIHGLARSLARSHGAQLDERGRLYLERIEANAASMQALVDDLLDFARIGIGEPCGPIDADAIAREAVAEARNAGAAVELLTAVPPLLAHPLRFKQALANLIDNAVRYGRSSVRVSARALPDAVEVAVEDDGPGVDPAERDRIFELFARGRAGRAEAPDGSGFGLALVRKIADSSGGSIRYEDGRSTGARFVLTFPKGAS